MKKILINSLFFNLQKCQIQKKKRPKKSKNPLLEVVKDISEDATKKIKKGIKDISKSVDETIKNIQSDIEKEKYKKLKQDPAMKKLQKETLRKANKKAKKKIKEVKKVAEEAHKDAEISRIEAEQSRLQNIELKQKVKNLEIQTNEIQTCLMQLDNDFVEIQVDISKLKEETGHIFTKIIGFENKIRNFIKSELKNFYYEHWWYEGIPPKIQYIIEDRFQKKLRELPHQEFIDKMKLMCFSNYPPIIIYDKNWKNIFWEKFPNKHYVEYKMDIVRKFRNTIAHGDKIKEDIGKLKTTLKELSNRISTI